MTKLTVAYIRNFAKRDPRINGIDVHPENQVSVWLDPDYTWCANDGNRTVNIYDIEGSDYQQTVKEFLEDIKMIEMAVDWAN